MLGFLVGAAASGNEDAGEALAGIFIGAIVCIILAIVVGSIYGISVWVSSEPISYETKIINTELHRNGSTSTYTVEFTNSFRKTQKVAVSYKEYKKFSENIGESIFINATTTCWKTESKHEIFLSKEIGFEKDGFSKILSVEPIETK